MKILSTLALAVLAASASFAAPGKILVMNDEWTLTDYGFSVNSNSGQFARNIASWATGGSTGSFYAYSTNFGLTGSSLANAMVSGGNSWNVGTGISFNLTTLLNYNGIFLSGNTVNNNVLIDYVNAGGTVVVQAGTGWGGSAQEAANWNVFLNAFGLSYGNYYNGVAGNVAINSTHALFNNVGSLYQNNGNNVVDINALDSRSSVLVSLDGQGLYGIYEGRSQSVPDQGMTFSLFAFALAGLAFVSRRLRK